MQHLLYNLLATAVLLAIFKIDWDTGGRELFHEALANGSEGLHRLFPQACISALFLFVAIVCKLPFLGFLPRIVDSAIMAGIGGMAVVLIPLVVIELAKRKTVE